MAQKSKWIELQSPDEAVEVVARRALMARLRWVWHFLPLAADQSDANIEYVHQLRVATRRALTTLEIFAPLLPKKRVSWMRKQLKRVRRAAGNARDFDVWIQRLEALAAAHPKEPGYLLLLQRLREQRRWSQGPIKKAHQRLQERDYLKEVRRLLKRVRLRGHSQQFVRPVFVVAARRALRPLVTEFCKLARGDFSDYAALHEFRLAGKQLRYAMEVFAGAFDATFRKDLYAEVERLQEKLGEINDHASARAYLLDFLAATKEPEQTEVLRQMVEKEQRAIEASRVKFLEWWTEDRNNQLRRRFGEAISGVRGSGTRPPSQPVPAPPTALQPTAIQPQPQQPPSTEPKSPESR